MPAARSSTLPDAGGGLDAAPRIPIFADAGIRLGVTWQQGLPVDHLLMGLEVADASEYRNEAPEYSWFLPEPLGHRLSRLRTWYVVPLDVALGKVLALWLENSR